MAKDGGLRNEDGGEVRPASTPRFLIVVLLWGLLWVLSKGRGQRAEGIREGAEGRGEVAKGTGHRAQDTGPRIQARTYSKLCKPVSGP